MKYVVNRNVKGFTLVEFMLVLVLVVAVLVGAYVLFGTAQQGTRSDQAQKNLLGLHAGVHAICSRTGQCPTLTQATLIQADQAPSDMVNGTALASPWGGAVTITATGDIGTGTDNGFEYTFNDVPRAECNTFVNAVQRNFHKIQIGGTTVKDTSTAYDTAAVTSRCDNDANDIVFVAP